MHMSFNMLKIPLPVLCNMSQFILRQHQVAFNYKGFSKAGDLT